MEVAISATYTAISLLHALNRDTTAGLLYLCLAVLYYLAGHHGPPPGPPPVFWGGRVPSFPGTPGNLASMM